uniref:Uncharacterized protein n=1 Tax=Cacopsylla melanoneura TaxID=428564 RepID=A0A8D9A8G1_9HEMI
MRTVLFTERKQTPVANKKTNKTPVDNQPVRINRKFDSQMRLFIGHRVLDMVGHAVLVPSHEVERAEPSLEAESWSLPSALSDTPHAPTTPPAPRTTLVRRVAPVRRPSPARHATSPTPNSSSTSSFPTSAKRCRTKCTASRWIRASRAACPST